MNRLKNMVTAVGFYALKQGSISASHFNKELQRELEAWPEAYSILLKVLPNGSRIAFEKHQGKLRAISPKGDDFDLIVVFKTEDIAFRIITTLNNVPKAFTQNRLMVYGNTSDSMILIRVLNIVQSYLFPPILSMRVLKRVPKFTIGQHIGRIRLYTLGLLLGY